LLASLTDEKRSVFEEIMEAVERGEGGVFFVYGYGGTGKTFIWRTLCAAIRSRGEIVLPVASSGIAATLIPGGRTAHSRFSIPIAVNETSTCARIKPKSDLTQLLIRTKLIIWDEAPMTHKHCFEALDRSMSDVMRLEIGTGGWHMPFGGKVIVFGGDFRQVLPVVPKGCRQDIVRASLSSSYLWQFCKVLIINCIL
jgi:ATP-dependent DNA helicase PIF1